MRYALMKVRFSLGISGRSSEVRALSPGGIGQFSEGNTMFFPREIYIPPKGNRRSARTKDTFFRGKTDDSSRGRRPFLETKRTIRREERDLSSRENRRFVQRKQSFLRGETEILREENRRFSKGEWLPGTVFYGLRLQKMIRVLG